MDGERSIILHATVRLVFPVALVFSIYLLFAGHNGPGGGFIGALVAGAAFVVRFMDRGLDEVRAALPISPFAIAGTGLSLAAATAAVSLVLGAPLLTSDLWSLDIPLVGTVKTGSTLLFDVGVYLVVVGLVIGELDTLGAAEES